MNCVCMCVCVCVCMCVCMCVFVCVFVYTLHMTLVATTRKYTYTPFVNITKILHTYIHTYSIVVCIYKYMSMFV